MVAYAYGAASYAYRLFPADELGILKRTVLPDRGRNTGPTVFADAKGREEVSCWSIDHDAAVILAMGQSNAGNYGETLYRPVQPVFNFNWNDGKCYRAEDPLLGSTGDRGSVWTRLGDALVETKRFKQVVIVPVGVGGSSVRDWAGPDGPSQRAVRASEALGRVGLHVTHVLWHQGEADYEMHKEIYSRLFARMTDYSAPTASTRRFSWRRRRSATTLALRRSARRSANCPSGCLTSSQGPTPTRSTASMTAATISATSPTAALPCTHGCGAT